MARYRKFIVALLTPLLMWAVALGWIPADVATPEAIASFATGVAGLVALIANKP